MPAPELIAFLVLIAILASAGLISNGFIVTVIIIEWTKSRSLSSTEQLLLSLGLSNFWSSALLTPIYMNNYVMEIFTDLELQMFFSILVFFVTAKFWFTAWLCVFYCIKIVNSTRSFFLWCKLRISWLIPRLLVGSLVISFVVSILATYHVLINFEGNTTENMTQREKLKHTFGTPEILFLVFSACCPLLAVLLCSILVVDSLARHVCRVRGKESNFRSLQTEAHIRAAGAVISLLCLYASFFLTHTLTVVIDMRNEKKFVVLVFIAYSPAQAAILLLINPKLKQAATWMLQRRTL